MLGIVARISVDVANAHATRFQNTTALVDIDEWLDGLSNKQQEKVLKHYKKMLGSLQQRTLFRATESGSSTTQGLSRFALVADEMMNGLDAAMTASDMFLTTTGGNNRRLLARICCTLAQVSGKLLQPLHHKAWGLAAVAADPTYFNTFNQLSIGYQHCHQSNKALEMANKARTFPESQTSWTLRERLALLMALFMAMIPERV